MEGGLARLAVVLPGVGLEPHAVTELDLAGLAAENKNLRRPHQHRPSISSSHPAVSRGPQSRPGVFLVLTSRGGAGSALQLQHGGLRGADLDDGVAHWTVSENYRSRALPPLLCPPLRGDGKGESLSRLACPGLPTAGLKMTLEVFTVAAELASSAAELLFGTVGVSGQVWEGLEAEGAGLAEILEFPEVFPLSISTGEFEF